MEFFNRLKHNNYSPNRKKMAGKDSEPKKSLFSHASEMLQKTYSKIQKSQKTSKSNNGAATDKLSETVDVPEHYVTWPSSRLRAAIEEVVNAHIDNDYPKPMYKIVDEIEHELNSEFPADIEEQLDFCMMCSENDHAQAVELRRHLCAEYDLVGKVFWECIPLGRDLFSVLEEMLKNSTRLLFYITERYDDSDACAYVARNLLVDQDNNGANRKVIPLVTEFDTPIPETFQLIDKLYLCSKLQFQFRFPAVFTREVRLEKHLRAEKLKRELDNERKAGLQILVRKKLEQ